MSKGKLTLEQLVEVDILSFPKEIVKAYDTIPPAIKKIADDVNKHLASIKQQALDSHQLEKDFKVAPDRKTFNKLLEKKSGLIEQNNALMREQDLLEKNLIKTIAKEKLALESTNRALIKKRYEIQKSNKLAKEQAILTSKTSSLIEKITVKRARAIRVIQDLNAKKTLGKKLSDQEQRELKESTKEYLKYNKAIKIAKNSTGQFQENVGNYPTSLGAITTSFKNLIPLVGAGFGLREAWNFTTELYNTAKEAKGVEFAFQRLGVKAQIAFDNIKKSTRGLLSDLDIKKSIVEFDNFNLSAEELDTVLEFVSVRAIQTGKSFEYLRDSAIEAISKESVRRADNLGLSQQELNDKIKEGATFLEAFGEIAKREISEAGDILDEATSSQQLFNAELENFKVSAGSGFIRDFIDGIYDLGSAFLSVFKNANEVNEIIGEIEDYGFWDGWLSRPIKDMFRLRNATAEYKAILEEYNNIDFNNIKEVQAGIDIWSEMKKEVGENVEVVKILEHFIGKLESKQRQYYEDARENHDRLLETQSKAKKLGIKIDGKSISELEELIKKAEEYLKNQKNNQNLIKGTISWYERLISSLEKEAKTQALTNKQWQEYREKIDEAKEAIDRLKNGVNSIDIDLEIKPIDTVDFSTDLDLSYYEDYGNRLAKINKRTQDLIKEQEKEAWLERLDIASSAISEISNLVYTLFEANISSIDNEIEKNNELYDTAIENAVDRYDEEGNLLESGEARRELLEKEKEKKNKKLEKKKREEQRKQAIYEKTFSVFQIGLNTASAIVEALPNIPLSIVAGALGALQLATVLATPLPQYKHGRKATKNELAITGDGGVNEIIENTKTGQVRLTPNTPTLTYLTEDDVVHPSMSAFQEAKGYSKDVYDEIFRQTSLINLNSQAKQLSDIQQKIIINNKIDEQFILNAISKNNNGLKKEIQSGFKNISIKNHVKVESSTGWAKG